MRHWKPKYRSLGAPPPLPNYILYDDDHWDREDFKGHKHTALTAAGTEAGQVSSKFCRSNNKVRSNYVPRFTANIYPKDQI